MSSAASSDNLEASIEDEGIGEKFSTATLRNGEEGAEVPSNVHGAPETAEVSTARCN